MRRLNNRQIIGVLISILVLFTIEGISARNGKIAFTSDRDGSLEIYVMNNDGSEQVRLTNNTDLDFYPAFSPNGRKIAFFSKQAADGAAYIKIMNADGTGQTILTPITVSGFEVTHPWEVYESRSISWSPDGRKIAFDDDGEIFTINLDGTDRRHLTNHPDNDIAPAWSPDGSRILFGSTRFGYLTMHTMNSADGSDVRRLPSQFYNWDAAPDWSPAGDKILFVELSEDWHPRIYTANHDGTDRRVFDGTGMGLSGQRNVPKWSPDGAKIAFQHWQYPSTDCEIYGALDTLFAGNGIVEFPGATFGLAVQRDGKIVTIGGSGSNGSNFLLFRCDSGGTPDSSFGSNGLIETSFGLSGYSSGKAVAIQPDGRIVAAGYYDLEDNETSYFALARYIATESASVGGRVVSPQGLAVRNATVILTDNLGNSRRAITGSFGQFVFDDVLTNLEYTLTVVNRRYRFVPRTIWITGDLTSIDLIGLE